MNPLDIIAEYYDPSSKAFEILKNKSSAMPTNSFYSAFGLQI